MPERQQHDLAFAISSRLLEAVRPLVPPDSARAVFDQCYTVCRQEIDRYEVARARQEARLRPMENGP